MSLASAPRQERGRSGVGGARGGLAGGDGAGWRGQLQAEVDDSGGNFSMGERQMLCLARALLARGGTFILALNDSCDSNITL